jgi:hypothetical protein
VGELVHILLSPSQSSVAWRPWALWRSPHTGCGAGVACRARPVPRAPRRWCGPPGRSRPPATDRTGAGGPPAFPRRHCRGRGRHPPGQPWCQPGRPVARHMGMAQAGWMRHPLSWWLRYASWALVYTAAAAAGCRRVWACVVRRRRHWQRTRPAPRSAPRSHCPASTERRGPLIPPPSHGPRTADRPCGCTCRARPRGERRGRRRPAGARWQTGPGLRGPGGRGKEGTRSPDHMGLDVTPMRAGGTRPLPWRYLGSVSKRTRRGRICLPVPARGSGRSGGAVPPPVQAHRRPHGGTGRGRR